MTRPSRLSTAEVEAALPGLLGWRRVEGREAIARTFRFGDFGEAFGWMTQVALLAEKMDHHPEWRNVYRTVEVVLATHSAGGVSELDLKMAEAMNRLAGPAAGGGD